MQRLKLNTWTAIFDIVDCVVLVISWFVIILAAFANGGDSSATIIYLIQWAGVILHIVALVQSHKYGVSIVGPVLGLIGCSLSALMLAMAFPSIVLLIIATVFLFLQRPGRNAFGYNQKKKVVVNRASQPHAKQPQPQAQPSTYQNAEPQNQPSFAESQNGQVTGPFGNSPTQPIEKKPWYKIWYFWVAIGIAVICVVSIIGGMSTSSKTPSTSQSTAQNSQKVQSSSTSDDVFAKTYQIGQQADYKGYQVKVNSVNYYSGNDMDKPDSGNQYVIANITIENHTNEKQDYNLFDFAIASDGNSKDADETLMEGKYSNNQLSSGSLDTNSSVTGNLVGQAKLNAKSVQLRYTPNFFDNKSINFNLK